MLVGTVSITACRYLQPTIGMRYGWRNWQSTIRGILRCSGSHRGFEEKRGGSVKPALPPRLPLRTALPSVALSAEHLAVIGNCASAFFPWCYVVRLHLLNLEMFATYRANTELPFVDFALGVVVE